MYLVTFTFTITKDKTFTYVFVPFAQLKRLCKFFPTPFGGLSPQTGYAYDLIQYT